ncbi:MAG: Ig-like domain-containing protein [Acidobacteriota bacterium]
MMRSISPAVGILACSITFCAAGQPSFCPRGTSLEEGNTIPFLGNRYAGIHQVTIYANGEARSTNFLDLQDVETGANEWNDACPQEESSPYRGFPSFNVDWEGTRPPLEGGQNGMTYRSSIQLNYLPNERAYIEAIAGTSKLVAAKWIPEDNSLELYGRCPSTDAGNLPCIPGPNGKINFSTPWGRKLIAHELGHALGFDHDATTGCSGPSVMQASIDPVDAHLLGVTPAAAQLAKNINDEESGCHSEEPAPGHTSPCDPLTPREAGQDPRSETRIDGAGADLCLRTPDACNQPNVPGGPWIHCGWACVTVKDGAGNIISTHCSWQCDQFALASAPANGLGPLVALTDPGPGTVLSGTVRLSGWAVDYAGVPILKASVDGAEIPLTQLNLGLHNPAACQPPFGWNHFACDPNSGFTALWDTTTVADGAHELQIIAFDSNGWVTPLHRDIIVDNSVCSDSVLPSAVITSPSEGSTVAGTTTVRVNASDNGVVTKVQLLIDGQFHSSDSSPPYSFSWNTTNLPDGLHKLRVRVIDGCENRALSSPVQITVQNSDPPPLLHIAAPIQDATVTEIVSLTGWATATDGVQRQDGVTFSIDGQPLTLHSTLTWTGRQDVCDSHPIGDPFCPWVGWTAAFDSSVLADGPKTLRVEADDGRSSSVVERQIVIANNSSGPRPLLVIDWPQQNQVVSGPQVTLEGWASDPSGIEDLVFTINGQPLVLNATWSRGPRPEVCDGIGSGDPLCPDIGWRASFDSGAIVDGLHTLAVEADNGNARSLAERVITVNNNPAGTTTDFYPEADSYAQQLYPDSALGGFRPNLSIRGPGSGFGRRSFVRFHVTGLSGPVTSAKLILSESDGVDIPEIRVWHVPDSSWNEQSLTWNMTPSGPYVQHSVSYDLIRWGAHELDVTPLVQGNGLLTIGLSTNTDAESFLGSRENQSPSRRPVLRITSLP